MIDGRNIHLDPGRANVPSFFALFGEDVLGSLLADMCHLMTVGAQLLPMTGAHPMAFCTEKGTWLLTHGGWCSADGGRHSTAGGWW